MLFLNSPNVVTIPQQLVSIAIQKLLGGNISLGVIVCYCTGVWILFCMQQERLQTRNDGTLLEAE